MVRTKNILSFFFVALFLNYYASTSFFSHLHIIDGTTIVHSHIHPDSHHDTKNGNHTKQSVTLIAQFSHFEFIDFSCNYILVPLQIPVYENKFIETKHWVTSIHLENLSLRAPPVLA